MKLMLGKLKELKGYVYRHRNLRIGRFTQHHIDQLNMEQNSIEYLRQLFDAPEHEVRKHLGRFGISGAKLPLQDISTLSGGQKSRVAFAELAWQNPHIMLLDEPTNHLDMEMIESLTNALQEFEGGIVLISHNQYVIESLCDVDSGGQIWVVDRDGHVTIFGGDFAAYKKLVIKQVQKDVSEGLSGISSSPFAEEIKSTGSSSNTKKALRL